ncbi:MAG: sulfite exporter TauE/SafE family protein [Lysobacterales bacterium]
MILALAGAILIGLSLGLLGSGGSILTVPVLVYLVGQPEKVAIAGALAIVGAISLIAALPWTRKRQVEWRSVLWFGGSGMFGTWFGAWLSHWVPGTLQLFLFALVMLVAAVRMARPQAPMPDRVERRRRVLVMLDGCAVGILTGLLGVGGGFLIVPALVLLGGLPVHRAVGTSLWIIAINAFTGFIKHLSVLERQGQHLDWRLIGLFILFGGGGALIGNQLAGRIPQASLRRLFAGFLVLMGGFIVWRTLPELLRPSMGGG